MKDSIWASKQFDMPIEELGKIKDAYYELSNSQDGTSKSYDELSDKAKELIDNLRDGSDDIEDVEGNLNRMSEASSRSAKMLKVLNSALTSLAIFVAVKTFQAIVNYETELADQAKKATDNINAQKQTLDNYSTRIQALYDRINSGQLTLDEHVEANRELREIQKELVDNFGNEASGIDLVTSSLEQQVDVLEKINNLKQSEYLKSNWENTINKETDSQKWINGVYTTLSWIGAIESAGVGHLDRLLELTSNGGKVDFQKEILGYSSNLDKMNKQYESFSAKIESTSDDMFNHIIASYNNVRKTTSGDFEIFGNVEQVKDTITHLQNDYKNFPGYTESWAEGLGKVWNKADDIVQKYGEAYHAQIQMTIASNEQYVAWQEELQNIYEQYEKANISGNKDDIDRYAKEYKDLINKIRASVQSETYQSEIISVVPEIADVDFTNFEEQINGVLNSDEVKQYKALNLPVAISADTADLYRRLKEVYDRNKEFLNYQFDIDNFESFINSFEDVMYGLNMLGDFKLSDELADVIYNGGSVAGKWTSKGVHFIAESELENIKIYKQELIDLANTGIDITDDVTIAFSNLTSKYGEDFTNLLTMILSKEGQLDWSEWLNEDGFKAVLDSLVLSSGLTEEQIKQILIGQGLIESDTRREVTNQIENFLAESFGDVELSDSEQYLVDALVNALMNTWNEEDLQNLPFIWKHLQVPSGVVPSLDKMNDALERFNETLKEVNQEENPFSTISDSVKDYSTDIKPWIDDLGSAYDAIFNGDNGFDIEVVDDAMLESIRNQFESIQQAFAENGIADAFDTQALEDFLAVLSDDATTAKEAQDAFNAYATSLFYSADGLKNLNEETANSIKQMLQKSGVENYEDVVNAMLDYQEALEYIEEKEIDLTKVTADEIQMLITKGEVSEAVAGKITLLAMQEQLVNINQMNFESSINALYALAKQCGIAEEYVLALEKAMANIKAVDQQYAHQTGAAADAAREGAERAAWEARKRLEEQVSLNLEDLDLKIKVPKVESGGGGKDAGKEEADEYLEAFNAELENLDWLHSNGKVIAVRYSNVA